MHTKLQAIGGSVRASDQDRNVGKWRFYDTGDSTLHNQGWGHTINGNWSSSVHRYTNLAMMGR